MSDEPRAEPLAEWERDLLAEHDVRAVLAEHVLTSGFDEAGNYWKYACGCSWTGNSDDDHRAHIAAMIAPVLAQARREGAAEAMDDAAEAWLHGGWGNTPRNSDRVADRVGAAQYAGDWLRARAKALRGDA